MIWYTKAKSIGVFLILVIIFISGILFEDAYSHGFPESPSTKYLVDSFVIKSQNKTIPIIIFNSMNHISEINLGSNDNSISFRIPSKSIFKQNDFILVQISIPKSFATYTKDDKLIGYVNNVSMHDFSLILDPYSLEDRNFVFFILEKDDLGKISQQSNNSQTLEFKLVLPGVQEKLSNYKIEKKIVAPRIQLIVAHGSPDGIQCDGLVLALRISGEWNCMSENTAKQMQLRGLIEHYTIQK